MGSDAELTRIQSQTRMCLGNVPHFYPDAFPGTLPHFFPNIFPVTFPYFYPDTFPRTFPHLSLRHITEYISTFLPRLIPMDSPTQTYSLGYSHIFTPVIFAGTFPHFYPETFPGTFPHFYPDTCLLYTSPSPRDS